MYYYNDIPPQPLKPCPCCGYEVTRISFKILKNISPYDIFSAYCLRCGYMPTLEYYSSYEECEDMWERNRDTLARLFEANERDPDGLPRYRATNLICLKQIPKRLNHDRLTE